MLGRAKKPMVDEAAAGAALREFEAEIVRQQDTTYGVALFFECVSLLHAEQDGVVETYRKQFRNIIQSGNEAVERATRLLNEAREEPAKAILLQQFVFTPCEGHPDPGAMVRRAQVLVETYKRLFPDRPRSQDFTEEETLRLIEEASAAFE